MAKNLASSLILAQSWSEKFLWGLPLLDVTHCCKLSLYAISRKTNEPNFKNLAPLVPRYYRQLSSCTISEKTNYPIVKKRSDGRTDG